MRRDKPMPRKFTRVNAAEKNGQRRTVLYSVAGAVRICGGPALQWSVSADVALSEKSPHLGGAWVKWSLQQEPGMQPDEPPSPILLLGRDRSPSGPALGAVRVCGRPALRCSLSADVALSEKSPYLGGAWVRWNFHPPGCSPRTSEVGTDLRAVRHRRRGCFRRNRPITEVFGECSVSGGLGWMHPAIPRIVLGSGE